MFLFYISNQGSHYSCFSVVKNNRTIVFNIKFRPNILIKVYLKEKKQLFIVDGICPSSTSKSSPNQIHRRNHHLYH